MTTGRNDSIWPLQLDGLTRYGTGTRFLAAERSGKGLVVNALFLTMPHSFMESLFVKR